MATVTTRSLGLSSASIIQDCGQLRPFFWDILTKKFEALAQQAHTWIQELDEAIAYTQ